MNTSPSPRKSKRSTASPPSSPPAPPGRGWPGCAASTTACPATATAPARPSWTAPSNRSAKPAPTSRPASSSALPCKPSTTTLPPAAKNTASNCSPRCSPKLTRTPHEPPAHRLLARRLRRPAARPDQPHHPSHTTLAPGRPRRPRPGTHLDPNRRTPRHHRRHRSTPLPEQLMISLTTITRIMPNRGRSLDACLCLDRNVHLIFDGRSRDPVQRGDSSGYALTEKPNGRIGTCALG